MRFSLWQIYFALFVFLGFVSLALAGSVSFFVYKATIEKVLDERVVNIQLLANTIGSPFWIHQELTHIPGTIENFLAETEKIPGVTFVWLVDDKTEKVEKGGDREDVGKPIEGMPAFESDVTIQDAVFEGKSIKILSVKSQAGDNIMMGVSLKEIQRRTLLSVIFLSYGILILLGLAGLTVFLINRRFLINPFFLLVSAFEKLKKEDYDVRISGAASIELNKVFLAFDDMVEKLAQVRDHERALAKEKTEFVAIAAHRLRTPLSAARWTLKLFLDEKLGKLTEEQRKFISSAYENNNRLILLVNSLLNIAEIESGKFLGKLVTAQPEDMLQSLISISKAEGEKKQITFEFEKPKEKLPCVLIDIEKLSLAIQNLLNNAVIYTPPGGKVTIRIGRADNELEFSVKDTGIGIPKDQQDKIFTRFFRAANAMKIYTEGSGFGLYIAKNIIEAHRGKIWFESEEGKGSTFFFRLPLVVPEKR